MKSLLYRRYALYPYFLCLLFVLSHEKSQAQQRNDSLITRLTGLRNDFTGKIQALGYTLRIKAPSIVLDNPFSYGRYDDSTNILHTCDWRTLDSGRRKFFDAIAGRIGHGMTGEKYFESAVHQWIFIHELGHWWRACQHQTANHYENEKAANRIDVAYWHEYDPDFYNFKLRLYESLISHTPSPVPAGQAKEKYLEDNYGDSSKFPASSYTWYQASMIVEISKEQPLETFKQAIDLAGKPMK